MIVVIDTAALYAVIDPRDVNHSRAVEAARQLLRAAPDLQVTNYVAVEALTLVYRRLGMESARRLQRTTLARTGMLWTTPLEHASAVEDFLDSGRTLSLVDCATMATMRARALDTIFTFDPDFASAGFTTMP